MFTWCLQNQQCIQLFGQFLGFDSQICGTEIGSNGHFKSCDDASNPSGEEEKHRYESYFEKKKKKNKTNLFSY